MRKQIKNLYTALAVMATIIAAHALPEMAIRFIPTWLLAITSVVFIFALCFFALWCLKQVIRLTREENN